MPLRIPDPSRMVNALGAALPLMLALTTAGCATGYEVLRTGRPTVSPWKAAPGLATVCALRPQLFAMAVPVVHHDNGRLVGLTRGPNVYFCWHAQPGRHVFTAARASGWGQSAHGVARRELWLQPGQRLYLRLDLAFFGADRLHAVLTPHGDALVLEMTYVETRRWSSKMRAVHRQPVPAADAIASSEAAPGPAPSADPTAPPRADPPSRPQATAGPAEPPDARYAAPPPPPQPGTPGAP